MRQFPETAILNGCLRIRYAGCALSLLLFLLLSVYAQGQRADSVDFTIRINQYRFDPLTRMPEVPQAQKLTAPDTGTTYRLIQFNRALLREDFQLLTESYGLKLNRYVSGRAYVERLDSSQLARLKKLDFYRWDGPFEPAYKISPTIGQMRFKTPQRQNMSGLLLIAVLAPETNTQNFETYLRSVGAQQIRMLDYRKIDQTVRFEFVLPSRNNIDQIAQRPEVNRIEEVPEVDEDNNSLVGTMQSGTPGNIPVWNRGIHGEGQIIHVLDSELDMGHCFFQDPANATAGPTHRKVVGHRGVQAGSGHGTFVAGVAAGDDFNNPGTGFDRGLAWAARITFSPNANPGDFAANLNAAASEGATIHTNSWHVEPTPWYDQTSFDADNFTWTNEDMFVTGSAGNTGERLGPPGTAKNVVCVGASQEDPNEANFGDGNNGPTPDGRRKPDLMAVGCNINSSTMGTACTTGPRSLCATSYATPATAGAAALVRQYYAEGWYPSGTRQNHHAFTPSGALLKATLLNSTVDMTGPAGFPNNTEGWGLILLDNALYFNGDARNLAVWDVRKDEGLTTGENDDYEVRVETATQALKITLVYSDAPGTAGSDANVLQNNLDMVVTAPNGDVFRGNAFAAGQSTTVGAADGVNNVEMVLLNTPQVGTYRIQIQGTNVPVAPGQGYALVASGDFPEPPIPTGNQNTLVVRLRTAGGSGAPLTAVTNKMDAVVRYVNEVSYGQTTIEPTVFPSVILMDHSYAHYYQPNQNPLIEMTEELIGKLLAANLNVFDRGTAATADDIDRIVLITNDNSFTQEWATTGLWPYDMPAGLPRRLSVSVNSIHNPDHLFSHNVCNQLGLINLHAHPGVVFDTPHVDEWDLMAKPLENTGLMAWSKQLVNWIAGQGSNIIFIPRPGPGAADNRVVPLNFITSTAVNNKAIAVGMSPGVNTLANENVFFFIEARSNAASTVDNSLPETGVLIYYVNENIPQGQGPVRIIDTDLTTPAGESELQDAALAVGQSQNITARGLNVGVAAGTGGANFNVTINYDPPETDNDVQITQGAHVWESPDIWVDSPKNGFDSSTGDRGDQPVTGVVNRIYVRITNPAGSGDAFDFDVFVRVSEPYHVVGGDPDFNIAVNSKHYERLNAGQTDIFFVEWTPNDDGEPHSCIQVEIPDVFNDVNPNNNKAQQNTEEVESVTASPYTSVTYRFGLTNPRNYQALFYFRPEDIPADWNATLSPRRVLLNPGERIEATLTLQPPVDAPVCTDHVIRISSWEAVGNTLIPVGGGTVQVDLRKRTDISLTATDSCIRRTPTYASVESSSTGKGKTRCGITTRGCTNPPRPFEEIIIRYMTPDGYPIYHTVTTDQYGCYADFLVIAEGGTWNVTAEYPGDSCQGSATAGPVRVHSPLPEVRDQDGDGVPDPEEPQDGDGDGDGQPCLLDPDCDNDGTPDGQESPGCITNPDCKGEGNGSSGKRLAYSFHVGSAHPLGRFDRSADANVHLHLDVSYILRDRVWLQLLLGFQQFTAEPGSFYTAHPHWLNVSANATVLFPTSSGLEWYLRGGGGYYRSKSGTNSMGLNVGLGGFIPLNAPFRLAFGTDYHYVLNDSKDRFLTVHLGVVFK